MRNLAYRIEGVIEGVCDIAFVLMIPTLVAALIALLVLVGTMAISGESIFADCCCKAVQP